MTERSSFRIGIDTGGTFTDLTWTDETSGRRGTAKVSSTPSQPSVAVFEALERSGCPPEAVGMFVLGTTIATNCLIERAGQRTVYVTTAGFEDVPYIQRVDRRSLYDLQWLKPAPYVNRRDCIGVHERVAQDGEIRVPLEDDEIARVVEELRALDESADGGIAVAISLLFCYANPVHEQRLVEALRVALPHIPVSAASEIAPIWREYERANTTIVDAYLKTLTGRFAEDLEDGLVERGVTAPRFLLKSNGGQTRIGAASRQPVNFILSGLAGGLIGGQYVARSVDRPDAITLDMGGTSADVGVIAGGRVRSSSTYEFEWGLPIAIPVIDIATIGAGGSSIAGIDKGGLIQVGPASAGADPGPASYGRGSEHATVTDANLVLGRLNPEYFLGGDLRLDPELAHAAVTRLADRLEGTVEDTAQAIVEMAAENMANAIRLLAADRGIDYRRFELMAFGGAGPLHAALVSRRVGFAGMIIPPNPGLTSALGAQVAQLRVDRRVTRVMRLDETEDEALAEIAAAVAGEALAELEAEAAGGRSQVGATVSARYIGQNFEQEVPVSLDLRDGVVGETIANFHAAHSRAYGFHLEHAVVEVVHVSATAVQVDEPPPLPLLEAAGEPGAVAERPVYFKGDGWRTVPVYRRQTLGAGAELDGPAIVEEVDSTTLVLEGQRVHVHERGSLLIEERADRTPEQDAGEREAAPA